jgi:hypothetical protein
LSIDSNIESTYTSSFDLKMGDQINRAAIIVVGLTQGNPTKSNLWGGWVALFQAN